VTAIVVSRTGDTKVEMRLATREDPVKNRIPVGIGEYNELMNCQVKDELVHRLGKFYNGLKLKFAFAFPSHLPQSLATT